MKPAAQDADVGGPLLRVDNLSIEIGGNPVVDGVSFDMGKGEVLALVGESGCGKSLTALALLRLLPPAARLAGGHIRFEGGDLSRLSERAMRRIRGERLSIIFQEPTASLDPLSTVGAQIAEAYTIHRGGSQAQARRVARDMLEAVGIPDPDRRLNQYPFELSGGMCQRIMIAIALICGPSLLVADEPTTALDVTIQAQILDLMKTLVAERGASVLLITHDMGVVADIAGRVAVMYAGRVVEIAAVEDLFREPRHPYTALLLASVPRLDVAPKAELATIEGSVPTPQEFGTGCRFAGRCPLAVDKCLQNAPPLLEVAPGRAAACWRTERVPSLMRAGA
jgi:peptide/nickel transport system ATP-binding protein